ncbi:hypothetical protein D3C72_1896570 [compost metagenome]
MEAVHAADVLRGRQGLAVFIALAQHGFQVIVGQGLAGQAQPRVHRQHDVSGQHIGVGLHEGVVLDVRWRAVHDLVAQLPA